MDLGKPVCSVFFDVHKAFDSVPHATLVSKLQSCGLNYFILRWICDYLRGREQRVVLNGVSSRPRSVLSEVPQESVLGRLLFILYINDLADLQLGSKMVVYADDILLYRSIETISDYNLMQEDVTSIEQWMTDNSLTMNAIKCKQMLITRSKTYHNPQLYLSGQPLEQVQSYKYLGVIITSDLSWSVHIQSICLKSRVYCTANSIIMRTQTPSVSSTCHVSGHILNTHVQSGTPTSLRRLRYWKMCKSLLAKYAANHGSWIMIVCWRIWIYHFFNKGGYS